MKLPKTKSQIERETVLYFVSISATILFICVTIDRIYKNTPAFIFTGLTYGYMIFVFIILNFKKLNKKRIKNYIKSVFSDKETE